ncbi:MAG: helix-turn-helix transcriptional regulator [Clostridiales bacterium]|nr:helix-turn-helix transcriptional regulator [Clostridiales bacterium]
MDLQALSQHLGVSTFHTIRIFKTVLLCTPMRYYNMLRLHEAGRLLLHTNWTVEEISRRLGYSSQFYFSQQFKKKMGVSPSAYKKLMNERD